MSLHSVLAEYSHHFASVVPFTEGVDRIVRFDFTENNRELSEEIVADTRLFSSFINERLRHSGARYGIGGYDEHRTIYKRSSLFGNSEVSLSGEMRRLHLGTDIWSEEGTPVMAPLDGFVHSFAFNDRFGDYGATIILQHKLNRIAFYTLYGHLNLDSIQRRSTGEHIKKGQGFANFGHPGENGHWPPHLHFQLIDDIGEWSGDYPGVCAYSEKERWLRNSPDPELILQMNRFIS